jgi:hypothetical protein
VSDFVEDCVRVPPMGTAAIDAIAEAFLAELAPETLEAPRPLDLVRLVEERLEKHGIVVYPATVAELQDREGATRPSDPVEILLAEHHWRALFQGGMRETFARSTLGHELGHAVLHVPSIRRAMHRQASP